MLGGSIRIDSTPGKRWLTDCLHHYMENGALPTSLTWSVVDHWYAPEHPDAETSFLWAWLKMTLVDHQKAGEAKRLYIDYQKKLWDKLQLKPSESLVQWFRNQIEVG